MTGEALIQGYLQRLGLAAPPPASWQGLKLLVARHLLRTLGLLLRLGAWRLRRLGRALRLLLRLGTRSLLCMLRLRLRLRSLLPLRSGLAVLLLVSAASFVLLLRVGRSSGSPS